LFIGYPYLNIWEVLNSLDDETFCIGVIIFLSGQGGSMGLEHFYNEKIMRIANNYGLLEAINEARSNLSVFVAMWFDSKMSKARKSIEKAVKENGYYPIFIDEKEHLNQIVEEIFYEIKKSKFVIADLTGQRGGVYYEAGYAEALGKKVILTCKSNDNEDPHFDVKQKNTIFWSDETVLYDKLKRRIKVTIKNEICDLS